MMFIILIPSILRGVCDTFFLRRAIVFTERWASEKLLGLKQGNNLENIQSKNSWPQWPNLQSLKNISVVWQDFIL